MNPDIVAFLQAWTGSADITSEDRQRLLQRLASDAEFRRACVQEVHMLGLCKLVQSPPPRWLDLLDELGLEGHPGEPASDEFAARVMGSLKATTEPSTAESSLWTRHHYSVVAIVIAIACVGLGAVTGYSLRAPVTTVSRDFVATLSLATQCDWGKGVALTEGQRLAKGNFHLQLGQAIVRLDGGASLLLKGPARFEIKSRSRVLLRSGEVLVRAEGQAAGFLLETPASHVTDLGTEFAVKVEASGATEVHVHEGLVSYRKPVDAADASRAADVVLTAGHAVRYDRPEKRVPREVELSSIRFQDALNAVAENAPRGKLLAYEPFAYSDDTLAVEAADGGEGWRGPWKPAEVWPVPDDPRRPLRFLSSPLLASGRLLDASDAFPQISRNLATPIRFDRDGIYYFSARVRWNPGVSPVKYMRQVRVILRSSTNPKSARYVLNMPSCLRPQIQRHDLEVFTSRDEVAAGDLQRWVLKIVARQHEADEFHFRIFQQDEDPGLLEPAWWHLSLVEESGVGVLDQVILDTYLAPDSVAFGDIRLGPSWRSVTLPAIR